MHQYHDFAVENGSYIHQPSGQKVNLHYSVGGNLVIYCLCLFVVRNCHPSLDTPQKKKRKIYHGAKKFYQIKI